MNHYLESRAAIATALKAVIGEIPLYTENKPAPASGEYFQFWYDPASRSAATLGEGGQDELTGFAQIDVAYESAGGFKRPLELLGIVESAFNLSRQLTYGSTTVNITGLDVSPARNDDSNRFIRSVTVYYRYRKSRVL